MAQTTASSVLFYDVPILFFVFSGNFLLFYPKSAHVQLFAGSETSPHCLKHDGRSNLDSISFGLLPAKVPLHETLYRGRSLVKELLVPHFVNHFDGLVSAYMLLDQQCLRVPLPFELPREAGEAAQDPLSEHFPDPVLCCALKSRQVPPSLTQHSEGCLDTDGFPVSAQF